MKAADDHSNHLCRESFARTKRGKRQSIAMKTIKEEGGNLYAGCSDYPDHQSRYQISQQTCKKGKIRADVNRADSNTEENRRHNPNGKEVI